MQFYSMYEQKDKKKVDEFIQRQASCRLITTSDSGRIHLGVFNHFFDGTRFYLHLNRNDEQIKDLRANSRALITIDDFLTVVPSYWVDEKYAGAATAYYRYVEFDCIAEVLDTTETMMRVLQSIMDHYQPEKQYSPLDPGSAVYKKSFDMLAIVRLTPSESRTKWKLGQNRSTAIRKNVADCLRKRGGAGDLRAAQEVEAWMATE